MSERVAIYLRVSSTKQSEDGASLETQEAACRAWCAERRYTVVGIERDVHSGGDLWERKGLERLRDLVRSHGVDILLAHAIDRLSRNQTHMGVLIDETDRHSVRLAFVTEELDNTTIGKFILQARSFAAEVQRERTSEQTKRGQIGRAKGEKDNTPRMIPAYRARYGYAFRDGTKRGAYDPDPNTAMVVVRIYNDCLGGKPLTRIATELQRDGIPSPKGDKVWSISTIHRILRCEEYIGEKFSLRTQGTRVRGEDGKLVRRVQPTAPEKWIRLPDGTVPALIDRDTFDAVQRRLDRQRAESPGRSRDPEAALLRGGYAVCGYCGHNLIVHRDGTATPYYKCNPANLRREGCPSFAMACANLDAIVWDKIKHVMLHPDVIADELRRQWENDPIAADLEAVHKRLASIERRQSNISRRVSDIDDDEVSAPLIAELRTLADQRRKLEDERAALAKRAAHRATLDDLLEELTYIESWQERYAWGLEATDYARRRAFLEMLEIKVKLYRSDHEPRWKIAAAVPLDRPHADNSVVSKRPGGKIKIGGRGPGIHSHTGLCAGTAGGSPRRSRRGRRGRSRW
jgi:DNA invertase Pin-like site-specific DNA recombinase